MSQNNLPTSLPSIERFIQKVVAAEKGQQKEIRISIQEARDLTAELAVMTSRLSKTVSEVYEMLAEIRKSSETLEVKFDGGGFQ
jgi:hypothetical protein